MGVADGVREDWESALLDQSVTSWRVTSVPHGRSNPGDAGANDGNLHGTIFMGNLRRQDGKA